MLDVMERYVDHIAAMFGRDPGQKRGYPGHQEIELALVKLYRLTGDKRRLDLAAYFIDERGREPHYFTQEALARGDDPARYWAGTMSTTSRTSPSANRPEWSVTRYARCIWPRAWPTLRWNLAMRV